MKIDVVGKRDIVTWLDLAKEVEPLFGPMIGQDDFHIALKTIISSQNAYCARDESGRPLGIIAVSPAENQILWLAVFAAFKGKGVGKKLLNYAIGQLNESLPIRVQTFADSVHAGAPARKLYLAAGFLDVAAGGLNPAGLPTVFMEKR